MNYWQTSSNFYWRNYNMLNHGIKILKRRNLHKFLTRFIYPSVKATIWYMEEYILQILKFIESTISYMEEYILQILKFIESTISYMEECILQILKFIESTISYMEEYILQIVKFI